MSRGLAGRQAEQRSQTPFSTASLMKLTPLTITAEVPGGVGGEREVAQLQTRVISQLEETNGKQRKTGRANVFSSLE